MARPRALASPRPPPVGVRPVLRAGSAAIGWPTAVLASLSCAPADLPHWRDGLVADSPCYRVDLADGLDEADPAEVEDLFACLDHWGHLESLRPAFAATRRPSPGGGPATLEIARAVNALPDAGADPIDVLRAGVDLLQAPDAPLDGLLDLGLEWIAGAPAPLVRAGAVSTDAPDVLASGVLAPLGPALPSIADAVLADPAVLDGFAGLLRDGRGIRWLDALARSPHPDVRVVHSLIGDLGDLAIATRDPSNDLWPDATGDGLRDLATTLVGAGDRMAGLDAVEAPAARLLGDTGVRDRLRGTLAGLADGGTLDGLPADLGWLARVDVDGNPARRGEVSALEALARLLDAGNAPMVCTLDLGLVDVDVDLGNLSVALLEALADADPAAVQSGAGLVGTVVGWDLSQSVLGWIADRGTCTVLTPTLVHDLRAIDLLFEDDATDLVVVALAVLGDLDAEGRIPEFVDTSSGLWRAGSLRAAAEIVRDTSDAPIWPTLLTLLPVFLDPAGHDLPADTPDFDDAWGTAHDLLRSRPDGSTWSHLAPVAREVVRHDGVWSALHHLAGLAADETSRTSRALDLVPDLVDADPDGILRNAGAALVADAGVARPLLRLAATPGVSETFLADTVTDGQDQVPLAFAARLVTEGAVDDLLSVVQRILTTLSADGEP